MSFLIVGASTVAVAPNSANMTQDEVGDRHRAFDGTYRSTVVSRPRVWKLKTAPTALSAADSLRTILNASTSPTLCSGDLLGSSSGFNCDTELNDWNVIMSSTGITVVVGFTLRESS